MENKSNCEDLKLKILNIIRNFEALTKPQYLFSTCHQQLMKKNDNFKLDLDFINGISRARGMEQVLMDLIDNNTVYLKIMEERNRLIISKKE